MDVEPPLFVENNDSPRGQGSRVPGATALVDRLREVSAAG